MILCSFSKINRFILHLPGLKKLHRKHKLASFNFKFLLYNYVPYSYSHCQSRSTIFALSTAPYLSAIAVIRISGSQASDVLYKMAKVKKLPEARKLILYNIKDPVSEELLDKALIVWFNSPNSFTGEDMCELQVHGGIAVIKSILSALQKMNNFRMAEPGEFTKRAFLANKLDLIETEGLADLIHAETEIQQKQALRQMGGVLNKLYNDWSSRIKKCLASVEAYIDFGEDQHLDDTILKSVQIDLNRLKEEIRSYVSDIRRGERLRNGISTVLIGKPNVGKSSLLNSLCQREIAIISPVAGTTRDILDASFNLDGYLVNISDTAGIRDTFDSVEVEGVKRAKDRSSKADLLLFIMEAKRIFEIAELSKEPSNDFINQLLISELGECFFKDLKNLTCNGKDSPLKCDDESDNIIVLLNKIDLLNKEEKVKVMQLQESFSSLCVISCTEGTGMKEFLSLFTNVVKKMCSSYRGEDPAITHERHRVFICNCLQNIISYEDYVNVDMAIAAEKLRIAMNELGKITGKVRVDDILDVIFKEFCIGK